MNTLKNKIQDNLSNKGKAIDDITFRECAYCLIEVYSDNEKLTHDLVNLKKSDYKFINVDKIKSQLNGNTKNMSNEMFFALSDLFDDIMQN